MSAFPTVCFYPFPLPPWLVSLCSGDDKLIRLPWQPHLLHSILLDWSIDKVQSNRLIIQDVSSVQHYHHLSTEPQSSKWKPSGPQWHPLPPAVTVIVSFHWAMLPLPAQVTSSTPLPRVQLRTIPGQGEEEMPFSFTLSGYFFSVSSFVCLMWPLTILRVFFARCSLLIGPILHFHREYLLEQRVI